MRRLLLLVCIVIGSVAVAAAEVKPSVGTIASMDEAAEIQHDGVWHPAVLGGTVAATDGLRTGPRGRLRIVFEAHSVLLLGNNSEVAVEDISLQPLRTHLRLLRGKARAVVEDAFAAPAAVYEIDTANAVAMVRGTDFVIVFDPVAAVPGAAAASGRTDVVGVDGRTEVHSLLDRIGHPVFVTARELAVVERGQVPTPPRRLDENLFKQYLEGLEFIGNGRGESATLRNALITGTQVLDADRADRVAGPPAEAGVALPHPAAPGEGGGISSDDRPPVIKQPPRASVLTGADVNVPF